MNVDISKIFQAVGPAASIIFAAWIFMGFLQQRYDSAVDRYMSAISEYRGGNISEERGGNLRDQVLVYKRRCELMNKANMIGLVAAILLILTLMAGELAIVLPSIKALDVVSATSALFGFALVIVAAVYVLIESSITHRQLDSELLDVADLAESTGQKSGDITAQDRSAGHGRRSQP